MPDQLPKLTSKALVLDASIIGRAHTILAYTAFGVALLVGCLCHYKKIVKNGVAEYPQEWFPSVSATIGDWYPERNVFQILIALTAGPRFALVACQYYLNLRRSSASSSFSSLLFLTGIIRTFSCGGWVYITSNDDHDIHDIFMITYMVCNLPWMLGGIRCSSATSTTRHKRILVSSAFFVSIVPLIYFFVQHKVHRVPGAYTHYAFFEWGLIFFDILYDSIAEQEFREAGLQVSLFSSIRSPPKFHDPVLENSAVAGLEEKNKNTTVNPTLNEVHRGRHTNAPMARWRTLIIYVSDLYQSYIFWSVLTALIPTLFYFSVWELGIAGHELAILSVLSPVLLGFRSVRDLLAKRSMQASLNLAALFGLATAFYIERPLRRLGIIVPTAMAAVLKETALWSGLTDTGERDAKVAYHSILLGLGLLLSSISKQLNHSNNPLWPFVNKETFVINQFSIVFGLLSVYEIFSRPTGTKTLSTPPTTGRADDTLHIHWLTAAVPLGSLLFTLQNLLADPSTLIAWSWTGYEKGLPRGPVPHLHGSLTIIAQCVGLLISIVLHDVSKESSNALANIKGPALLSRHWLAVGSMSAYIMYSYKNWAGYAGGLGFAVFLMSISPYILQRAAFTAAGGKLARTYFMAFLVYCVLNVASIFTVAYAFVPGGVYFRERTDLVLFIQVAFLALAFRGPQRLPRVSTLNYGVGKHIKSFYKNTLAVLSVLSLLATLYRWPIPARPFKPASRIVNTGIWTLHFGFDNVGRDSQQGVTNLIRDLELDIVGFLETDLHRTCFGHRDLTRVAVEELGYNVDIGPGPNSHTWGAVLLSKFPIINSTHHLLPSPRGELAPAIEAVLDIYGTAVTVVVAHNGQEEDPLDRELQSKELARIMSASYPRPVIFLGYVVTKPRAARPAPYQILIEDGRMHDIDDEDLDRWCEYILYRGLYRTSYARVSRGVITDTELQVGQFVLPRPDVGVLNETRPARYLRAFKEEMREEHWFPMAYYGDDRVGGVNGHYYHVFYTPLYYKVPEGAVL